MSAENTDAISDNELLLSQISRLLERNSQLDKALAENVRLKQQLADQSAKHEETLERHEEKVTEILERHEKKVQGYRNQGRVFKKEIKTRDKQIDMLKRQNQLFQVMMTEISEHFLVRMNKIQMTTDTATDMTDADIIPSPLSNTDSASIRSPSRTSVTSDEDSLSSPFSSPMVTDTPIGTAEKRNILDAEPTKRRNSSEDASEAQHYKRIRFVSNRTNADQADAHASPAAFSETSDEEDDLNDVSLPKQIVAWGTPKPKCMDEYWDKSDSYPYPPGYCVKRQYYKRDCLLLVEEGDDGPVFVLEVQDGSNEPERFTGNKPTGPVQAFTDNYRREQSKTRRSGPKEFLFSLEQTQDELNRLAAGVTCDDGGCMICFP